MRIRQDVHHQVTVDGEAHFFEEPRQFLRLPVPNGRARIHDLVEGVGEPALVGGAAIHILDEEPAARRKDLRHLLEERTHRLLVKDVERRPAYKRWFTHALDWLMDPGSPVRYWSGEELQGLLEEVGFTVFRHLMVDFLPYPHILYICGRRP